MPVGPDFWDALYDTLIKVRFIEICRSWSGRFYRSAMRVDYVNKPGFGFR